MDTQNPISEISSASFGNEKSLPNDLALNPFQISKNESKNHEIDVEGRSENEKDLDVKVVDYTKRAQWLRAAVLGANDGLLSTASLMVGVGAVRSDVKTMVLTGVAGMIAGASSMALGEFVSVYSQYDIELSQLKRSNNTDTKEYESKKEDLPSPLTAMMASGFAFAVGALVPLLAAAFIKSYQVRLGVVVGVVSLALLVFGGLSAYLGKAPVAKSSVRVLIGGWLAMGITFGFTKLVGKVGV